MPSNAMTIDAYRERSAGTRKKRTTLLVVTALPSLATRWLPPRLPDFGRSSGRRCAVDFDHGATSLNLPRRRLTLGVRHNGDGHGMDCA